MNAGRGLTLTIRTPEGIRFAMPLAGPVSRCLAWSIDFLCIMVLTSTAGKLTSGIEAINRDTASAINIVAYFVISIGYAMSFEWFWRGQTVGKRLTGLRVVDASGLRLQPSQVILRNLLRFVDMLPAMYFVGGISSIASRYSQRLGDLAAGTVVIRSLSAAQPDLEQVSAGKYNSLREAPHLVARLRQNVSPEAAQIALQAVLRRDEFDPVPRGELFNDLRCYFNKLVTFPPELVDQITDEQFVRNIVQVLFERSASIVPPRSPVTV